MSRPPKLSNDGSRKDSKFVSAFKNKGIRFHGGRGCQILLYRKFVKKRKKNECSNPIDVGNSN